ncbi:S8 family serine peptidase [Streptomyces sp. 3211]|uniref:S8 family serine peptidase n=1 Tax=Streptomyces sp. 3211 TaxID=1964449 RepID=UPI0009A50FBA|nr:S8 family serine peptidase [Streptomyces sp. 3211]
MSTILQYFRIKSTATALATAVVISAGFASSAIAKTEAPGDFRPAASDAIEGQFIVALKKDAEEDKNTTAIAQDLVSKYGGEVGYVFKKALRGFSIRIDDASAREMSTDPSVDYIEQNERGEIEKEPSLNPVPSPQEYDVSWNMDRIDQRTRPLDGSFNSDGTQGGATTRIYVTDTGINPHKTFGNRVEFGVDVTDDRLRGKSEGEDCHEGGHGTASASVAAGGSYATDSGDSVHGYGVARGAKIVNVKWANCEGFTDAIKQVQGLDWILDDPERVPNKSVIDMSSDLPGSTFFYDAVTQLVASGTVVVASAHNYNDNVCTSLWAPIYAHPGIILVGATNESDTRAQHSNYGGCIDMWAPGENIPAASHTSNDSSRQNNFGGTSAAAPAVAGAVALLQQRNLGDPAAIRGRLQLEASEEALSGMPNYPALLLHVGGHYAASPSLNLVDNGSVVSPAITVNDQGDPRARQYLRVKVAIIHHTRGDLALDLIAPDGTSYRFRNPAPGDTASNIFQEFNVDAHNEAPNGAWKLRVTDTKVGSEVYDGRLDTWSLQF